MASVSYSTKLSESKYTNWVKAGLAVLFTKEGIEPFVYDEIEQFQQKCLTDICNNNGLPAGSLCSCCCTENVVVCPTNRICNARRRRCGFHRNAATRYNPAGCPNKICNDLKNKIQNAHRFYGPSFKNTDATQWCSNPWEIAKCFMPPDGYKGMTSVSETDFNGINSVIINFNGFQSKINDNLGIRNNIFEKARDIGKAVRHSPTLEVEDTNLQQYFADLQNLLSDAGYLATSTAALDARKKLSELQNDTLVIGKEDIKKVLEDVANAVQDRIKAESNKQKKNHEKRQLELIKETKKSFLAIRRHTSISASRLQRAISSVLSKIDETTKESVAKIETQTRKGQETIREETKKRKRKLITEADKATKKMKKRATKGVKIIASETDDALKKIKKEMTVKKAQSDEDKYNTLKRDLQTDLIAHYREKCGTIPVSPVLEESAEPMLKVYTPPYPLYSVETDPLKRMSEKRRQDPATNIGTEETEGELEVDSLSAVFRKRRKLCKNIYVTAEPGVGKTSFVKWLTLNWCQAHRPVNDDSAYFEQEEVDQMKNFDFLFVVFLRETSDTELDSMIMNIASQLARQSAYKHEALERILFEKNCLIVLDGLDEWEPAVTIPKRKSRENCTYVTTSRPWKFCMLDLNSTQIDQHIQIKNISEVCTEKLLPKIFTLFEEKNCMTDDVSDVNDACRKVRNVLKKKKLAHFYDNPVMFVQLIFQWNMTGKIGNTQCEIYRDMIDYLVTNNEKRFQLLRKFKNKRSTNIDCSKSSYSGAYYDLVLKLGKLAFETLFTETKESPLVFDDAVASKYLPEDEFVTADEIISACLHLGLLTKQSVYVGGRRKTFTYSFFHKTIQEYFAASYIQSESKEAKVTERVQKRCNSLSDVLEMGTVFLFLSGLDPTSASRLLQALQIAISKDEATVAYRSKYVSRQEKEFRQMKAVQDMIVSCTKECKDNGHDGIQFPLEDVFVDYSCNEESYSSSLKTLIETNCNSISSLDICTSNMNIENDVCTDFKLSHIHSVCTLKVDEKNILNDLQSLLTRSTDCITCLCSSHNHYFDTLVLELGLIDAITGMTHLEALHLEEIEVSHNMVGKFVKYVEQQTRLRYLYLGGITCSEHRHRVMRDLKLNLSEHKHLHEVKLWKIPLTKLTLNENLKQLDLQDVPLPELKVNKSLQQLELSDISLTRIQLHENLECLTVSDVPLKQFNGDLLSLKYCWISGLPAGTASDVFRCLPANLHTLICSGLESQDDVSNLLDRFPKLIQLNEVNICNADFGLRPLGLQPKMKTLQTVDLAGVSMTQTALHMLLNATLEYEQEVTVDFCRLTVTNDNRVQQQSTRYGTTLSNPRGTEECSGYEMKIFLVRMSMIPCNTYQMMVDTLLNCKQPVTLTIFCSAVKGNAVAPSNTSSLPQMRGKTRKYVRLNDVSISSRLLQYFIHAVERCQYPVSVMLFRTFEEGSSSVQNYIRSSSSFITTWYGDDRLDLSTK